MMEFIQKNCGIKKGGVIIEVFDKNIVSRIREKIISRDYTGIWYKIKKTKIKWSTIYEYIVDLIYPRRCPVCDKVLHIGEMICLQCDNKFRVITEPLCKKCGKQVDEDNEYCYDCGKKTFSYEEGRAIYLYDDLMKKSIAKFKYKGRCEYADFYVEKIVDFLGETIYEWGIDVIIPVPIHKNKLRLRGFNQADIIAKRLGRKLGIEVLSNALIRVEDTVPQKGLDNIARKKNVINAISINDNREIPNCVNNILLIDDIYTTGATIDACTKKLKILNKNYKVYFVSVAIGYGL